MLALGDKSESLFEMDFLMQDFHFLERFDLG